MRSDSTIPPTRPAATAGTRAALGMSLGTFGGLLAALIAMLVLFGTLSPTFFSLPTFTTIANEIPDLLVMAVGMTFILMIGGTSLMGGRGSVVRTLFGVLIISVLESGLAQIGASEPTKRIITGAVIVAAVVMDTYRSKRNRSKHH